MAVVSMNLFENKGFLKSCAVKCAVDINAL
jgi:hypothetical protein